MRANISFSWRSQGVFFASGDTELRLTGIPAEIYIGYDVHAYRFADAQFIADVTKKEFASAVQGTCALTNPKYANEGDLATCTFTVGRGQLQLATDPSEHDASSSVQRNCKATIYPHDARFEALYCQEFLLDVAKAEFDFTHIRFYGIDPKGIIIAEPLMLDRTRFDERCPQMKCPRKKENVPSLLFFFTTVRRDDE